MNALTYDLREAAAAAKAAAPAAPAKPKGFWARVLDALIEARMRQAEREIRMHAGYLPDNLLARTEGQAADADKRPSAN